MRIFVLFVEPMLYILDLIHEVYEETPHEYLYVFCNTGLTGKDNITLPTNSVICTSTLDCRSKEIKNLIKDFCPDFAIINGYVGKEQVTSIRYCQRNRIPYAIESDTPLHIPCNFFKATAKRLYLTSLLKNRFCFGFPGGTPQKENLVYYGIPEHKNFIMPMSVSEKRLLKAYDEVPEREVLREKFGLSGKKVFLFVGRLEKVKNVELLIKAFRKLTKERNDIALLIVGDGTEMRHLTELSSECADIYFIGYKVFPELVSYYKMSDWFVLPSLFEPWGLVVNEAMTFGLPVIVSTAVGCQKDLIIDGFNGYVFENRNYDQLANSMHRIMEDEYEALQKNVKKTIKNWNFAVYMEKFQGALKCLK